MEEILSLIQPEPWTRFTVGLIAAMAFARGLDFLSTWIVTPRLALEANPLMRRLRWGRMALTILTKSFQEQGGDGTTEFGALMVAAEGGARGD